MTPRYTSRLTSILASFVFGFLLVSFLASTAQAQVEQIGPNLRVIHAVKHDVSPPLRSVDVSALPPMRRGEEDDEIENKRLQAEFAQRPQGFTDPALQATEGNRNAPPPLQNFSGIGNQDNVDVLGLGVTPPDPNIEVGDQYVVEMINIVTAVYDKNGNQVMAPIPNNGFWSGFGGACENQNRGDPIVLYDQGEDRWMVSQFASPIEADGMQCVAISVTDDPTGAYHRYAFPTQGTDYPKMGVGTEAYYLSWRDFTAGAGMVAAALEKDSMLVGNDADMIAFGPDGSIGTRPPADIDGALPSASTPHPFAALQQDAVSIYGLNPDFQDPSSSTFNELVELSVDPFDSQVCSATRGQCVPQPNGPDLETLSGVIMHRLNVRDMGDHMSMVASHTVDVGSQRAGVRWYEFRNDGSGWTVHQQGTFAPEDGQHRWMPSIALNASGGIAVGYSVSSSDLNPAIRYTGRPAGAPLGEMTFEEETIFQGEFSDNSARWGDYTAMTTDAANPGTFWYVNQNPIDPSDLPGEENWDTRIASFTFDVDDETPPEAITDLSASPAGPVEIDLTWTAPSDPPDGEAAGSYDVRYSTDPIEDSTDFANAQQVDGEPAPSAPGTTDSMSVGGLSPDTEYFFGIRSSDVVGNTSDLNTNLPVSATTDAAPVIATEPDSVTKTLNTGESGSEILSILNEGAGTLTFSLAPEIGGTEISDPLGGNAPTASADNFPKGKYEPSAGTPPENGEPTVEEPQQMVYQPELGETVYYGVNSGANATEFVSFLGNNPEVLNSIGSYPGGGFPNAGDFPADDDSFVYDLNNDGTLYSINVETGESEELGSVGITTDWCGMTTDPNSGTIYAVNCSSGGSTLYELNPDAVEVEEIGSLGVPFMIDIAVDGEGQMYGYDISSDVLHEINKETGETTEVGSIGFDANFGQGLTWDTKNQALLMSAFNNAAFQPEFRSVDRQTGATELIGVLGADTPSGTDQLGWVGTSIDAIPQWLTAAPTEGEVEAGGSQDIDLSFMTTFEEDDDLIGGLDYFADVAIESNDPSTPMTNVPVTLTVEGNPAIGFSDDPLDFGQVFSGTSQTDTLSIINESDDAILQVANLQIDGEAFTLVDNSSFVLDPGESMGLPITFSPDASATFEGTLSLASSAGDQEVGLVGQGVPFVSISPDSLSETIDLTTGDSTATDEFTITNEFSESLPFDVVIEALEGSGNSLDLTPKLADEQLRRWRQLQQRSSQPSEVEPSLKPAPNKKDDGPSAIERFFSDAQLNDPVGVTAYGNEALAPEIVSFDIGTPGSFTILGEGMDSFAGNFTFANNDQIYWIDNADNSLKTYTLDDGSVETVGELEPVGSEVTWTDMETDPTDGTTYVTSGEGSTNRLYELDVDDAELTHVGDFGGGDLVVAFAIDGEGVGYAHDISDDEILTVDVETAESSPLGPTGINANFAQSMTWDGETGQVLMAALHDCGLLGCNAGTLRQVNRETGNTTAIGSFPDGGGDEFGWLATPGTGIPWLSTNLEQGVLPAGASLTLEAQYDASGQVEGEYNAQISIVGSELEGEPSESLPVTLTVEAEPILFLSENSLEYDSTFVNDTTSTQMVTLRNDGAANMTIDVSLGSDNFMVTPNPDSAITIEPGDARIFDVAFTPTTTGELTATLSFEGDEVSGEVSLSGTGIPAPELAVDPESFEKQAYVGQQQEHTLEVSNVGANTLEYSLFSTTGDLLNQDFSGDQFPPEGWFRAGANDGQNWTTPEASACDIWIPNEAACFYWSPSTVGTQRLVTKQLNTQGQGELTVEFTHIANQFSGDYELRLETSGDGGETWTTVATFPTDFSETEETITIDNEDVGSDEFHLAWTYDGDSFNINSWGVLDVQIGTPDWLAVAPDSGALTAGETKEHTVSVDATGLQEGTLQAAIVANTNDPTAETYEVPFILHVIEELSVQPNPSMDEVHPNEEFAVDFGVESLDDLQVYSYELTMEYNPDRMQVQEVVTDGTLSEGLTLSSDIDNEAGTVTIAAAEGGEGPTSGNGPALFQLEGQGTLVSLDAQGEPDLGDVTLDMTNMVFNEGEPPATAKDSTISIVPLYGDVNLDLSITAADAMTTLDYVAGKTSLIDAQQTQAEVSGDGDISAFDASLILRRTVGDIDCFPVEPTCDDSQPALAGKSSSEASSEEGRLTEIFAWGEVSRTQPSAAKSSSSGTTLSLPLKTDQAVWSASYGNIRAIEVTTEIDPDKVSVQGLKSQLPDDWRAVHHVSKDGTLKISMAGTTPLAKVGKVATLTLQRNDSDAKLKMGGNVTVNEGSGHELETKSIVSIPDEFALEGTYPNPFRQSATLKMDLPKKANVTVEVYDLLGRRVKTAHNGEMSAGTGRTVRINGTDMSSGTYFYRARVEMGDNVQTRSGKMTVVQ